MKKWMMLTCLFSLVLSLGYAIETPTSDDTAAMVDNPMIRIPFFKKVPKIDGVMEAEEWEDATALSGFWSSNTKKVPYPLYQHLGPHQIQSYIYAGYDRENLYLVYRILVYPEGSWLKARGRFPDVYNHPMYGLKQDDHLELELRPMENLFKAFPAGMYKWFINPIGVVSDQHWTNKYGQGRKWQSGIEVKTSSSDTEWLAEMRIPLKNMRHLDYAGKDEKDRPLVKIPPPDGTAYRVWFKNGLGGAGLYTVLFDQHVWNTTKFRLMFDSKCVAVQVNELGPMMEDSIDVHVSLKNHHDKSQSVRLGFFVENNDGHIFSSYEDDQTQEGIVDLLPGESKKINFKKKLPGISRQSNYLWFDVRSAGRPAKILYQSRLTKFLSTDPGPPYHHWKRDKLDSIQKLRPKKADFVFKYQYSPYTNRISATVDKGIYGASEEAKSAVEAKLILMKDDTDETEIKEMSANFTGNFATFLMKDLPELEIGHYKVSLLLFDKNQQIVGERNPDPFYKGKFAFEKNKLGMDDQLWRDFTPIKVSGRSLDMFKHKLDVDASGLPAQIDIKADERELPLELRGGKGKASSSQLLKMGRGPQLRSPLRFEAMVKGQRVVSEVVEAAKALRTWSSEVEYQSKLKCGSVNIGLKSQYDCDGSIVFNMEYDVAELGDVELLELVMEVDGPVDFRIAGGYGMLPMSGMDMRLPEDTDAVVWDSANDKHMEPFELYYSKFVPYLSFGSGDRSWTWFCDSDQGWVLDRNGTSMTLERDKDGMVTWRIKFINHKGKGAHKGKVEFALLTHPAHPKEKNFRRVGWLNWPFWNLGGTGLVCLPNDGPHGIDGSDETFKHFKSKYPTASPYLYINKNWVNSGTPPLAKGAYTGEWLLNSSAKLDKSPMDRKGGYGQPWTRPGMGQCKIQPGQSWEDYFVYHLERQIRIGQVPGWWWDELFLPWRSECVANGQAYFRDLNEVKAGELPWQSNFSSLHARDMLKRLAKLIKKNNLKNYNSFWATSQNTMESYGRTSWLVESAAAFSLAYEIDNVTRFPLIGFRFAAGTHKGLTVSINHMQQGPKGFGLTPGDDLRLERAVLGRALLHDIASFQGFPNMEQFNGVVRILEDFGYFDDDATEFLPYWRSRDLFRYGEELEEGIFSAHEKNPHANVHVSAYRRRLADGKGFKVLFIVQNENLEPVRGRLHLKNSKALFGKKNTIRLKDIMATYKYPRSRRLSNYHKERNGFALKNLESGGAVLLAKKAQRTQFVKTDTYGPIHIVGHDFKILYGEYNPSRKDPVKPEWENWVKNIKDQNWYEFWDRPIK